MHLKTDFLKRVFVFFAAVLISSLRSDGFALPLAFDSEIIRYQEPEFLTFEELKMLSENPEPDGKLGEKLGKFWVTPIISNEAYYRGVRPNRPHDFNLGSCLRIASWNIEKSYHMDEAIKVFQSPETLIRMMDETKVEKGSALYWKMLKQRDRLAKADVLILQEMDIGHKRSGYINAAAELAKALDMNYTYGAQQLEIDPVYLGTEKLQFLKGGVDQEMTDYFATDPARYKGVFGSAVLSRYPIKHVEVFQLRNKAYDWYSGEKPKVALAETARRLGTEVLFKNRMVREMKVGGRIYFRVDLEVPDLPEKTLTIINIHLEIKCLPKARKTQMEEILGYIKDIHHPVVVMGDFNAAPTDISPTSVERIVKRSAKDPKTWVNGAVTFLTPYGPLNVVRGFSNITKNFQDPLAKNIPVVAPNDLKPMFDMIENFRFADGGAFDFRGDQGRSMNSKHQPLSNSNERDFKGFKTTWQVKRPIGPWLGKLRLDWVFVKGYLKDPKDKSGSYRFAPHFGETLEELNTHLEVAVSDHHPNVVDLPFEEPRINDRT